MPIISSILIIIILLLLLIIIAIIMLKVRVILMPIKLQQIILIILLFKISYKVVFLASTHLHFRTSKTKHLHLRTITKHKMSPNNPRYIINNVCKLQLKISHHLSYSRWLNCQNIYNVIPCNHSRMHKQLLSRLVAQRVLLKKHYSLKVTQLESIIWQMFLFNSIWFLKLS